jgi:hypothetical protein
MLHDMTLWSHHYGVPFRVPSRFPLVTLRTQRALAGVERSAAARSLPAFALALFTAYWAEDQDVTTDAVIGACAIGAGLDAATVLAAIDAPETKDLLRATTDEAIRRGAFGAPAMFVGDALFWDAVVTRGRRSHVTPRQRDIGTRAACPSAAFRVLRAGTRGALAPPREDGDERTREREWASAGWC